MATIQTKLTSDNRQHDEAFKKSKQQVYNYNKQVDNAKRGIMEFAGKLAAAVITIETFKKVMDSTERTTDVFGSTMEQAKAAAAGFFSTIANGNIGGFIESLKDLTKNAKDAYEALDALGTDKMWANRRLATIDAQLAEAKLANNTKKINVLLAERKRIIQNLEGKTEDAFMSSLINELGKRDSSFDHQMAERLQGLTEEDKKQIMYNLFQVGSASDLEELTKRYYNQNKNLIGYDSLGNMNGNIQTVIYELYKQISNIPESYLQVILALQEDAERLKRDNARITKRYTSDSSSTSSTSTPIDENNKWDEKEYLKNIEWNVNHYYTKLRERLNEEKITFTPILDPVIEERPDASLENVLNTATEMEYWSAKEFEDAERRKQEAAEKTAQIFRLQIDSISSLGSALTSLGNTFESKGLNIAGVIAEAIANIIKSFSFAMTKESMQDASIYQWIAASVSGLATLTGTISQIHSLSGYAEGGIIGGNSYTGDKVLARVNSGEMILNHAQQARLFDMINTGGVGSGQVEFKIKGQELVGVLNNYNKINGRVR